MGNPAVSRSRRVAASRAITRDTPGKAGTNRARQEARPEQSEPPTGSGKKHGCAPSPGPAPPGVGPASRNPRPAGRRDAAGRTPGRQCRGGPRGSSTLSNWPAAWRASTHDRPSPKPAPTATTTSLAGLVQVEQVLDRVDAVGHRHDVPAGGRPAWPRGGRAGATPARRRRRRKDPGSSTASALSPSELATAARRRRSGSSTRTAVVSASAADAEPPGRRPRPRHTRGSARVTDRYRRPEPRSARHRRTGAAYRPVRSLSTAAMIPAMATAAKRPSEQSHVAHLGARAAQIPPGPA